MKRVSFLALLGMLFFLYLTLPAYGEEIKINVKVILASNQGKVADKDLHDIQKKLKNLFKYSSYQLLKKQSLLIAKGKSGQIPLTEKKALHIKFLNEAGKSVEIAVEILEKGKKIFKTKAKIQKKKTLLIGGPKYKEGVLIMAISVQAP